MTHDLAMSLDGKILYGLDDPALSGGAKAIRCPATTVSRWASSQVLRWTAGPRTPARTRGMFLIPLICNLGTTATAVLYTSHCTLGWSCCRQLNLTTMVPLPAFVVKSDSTCSALAAGGPQGPIVACHGEDHPINSEPVRVLRLLLASSQLCWKHIQRECITASRHMCARAWLARPGVTGC